jgi:hypothetical protein
VPNQQVGQAYGQGKVWVYRQQGTEWQDVRNIVDDSGRPSDYFGFGIGIDGQDVIIGAYHKNDFTGKIFFVNME